MVAILNTNLSFYNYNKIGNSLVFLSKVWDRVVWERSECECASRVIVQIKWRLPDERLINVSSAVVTGEEWVHTLTLLLFEVVTREDLEQLAL